MKTIFTLLLAVMAYGVFARQINTNVIDLINYRNGGPRKPNESINIGGCRAPGIIYIIDHCGPCIPSPSIQTVAYIDFTHPGSYILTWNEINQLPSGRINDYISLFPGIYQSRRGDELDVYGGRSSDNLYILDGVILGF